MNRNLLHLLSEPGALTCRFQPIVYASDPGKIHAVESLTRGPKGTLFESPQVLFDYVRRKRAEVSIERECVQNIFADAQVFPASLPFSINIHASTLTRDRDFAAMLQRRAEVTGVVLSRVIVEIVEHAPAWNQPAFLAALKALRAIGIRIALDDIGLGNSNYRMVLDAQPEYFKMDAYICRGAHADAARRAVVRSVVQLARDLGGATVAEGIEVTPDFETMVDLGVDYIQGYLFHKPMHSSEIAALMSVPKLPVASREWQMETA